MRTSQLQFDAILSKGVRIIFAAGEFILFEKRQGPSFNDKEQRTLTWWIAANFKKNLNNIDTLLWWPIFSIEKSSLLCFKQLEKVENWAGHPIDNATKTDPRI